MAHPYVFSAHNFNISKMLQFANGCVNVLMSCLNGDFDQYENFLFHNCFD